MMDKITAL